MTKFRDGPAAGVVLTLRRAPIFLRVVRDPAGMWDGLDQLADTPAPAEAVCAYRKVSDDGTIHVDGGRDGRRFGLWLAAATYEYVEPQPAEGVMRVNEAWRAWCQAEYARIKGGRDA